MFLKMELDDSEIVQPEGIVTRKGGLISDDAPPRRCAPQTMRPPQPELYWGGGRYPLVQDPLDAFEGCPCSGGQRKALHGLSQGTLFENSYVLGAILGKFVAKKRRNLQFLTFD